MIKLNWTQGKMYKAPSVSSQTNKQITHVQFHCNFRKLHLYGEEISIHSPGTIMSTNRRHITGTEHGLNFAIFNWTGNGFKLSGNSSYILQPYVKGHSWYKTNFSAKQLTFYLRGAVTYIQEFLLSTCPLQDSWRLILIISIVLTAGNCQETGTRESWECGGDRQVSLRV